MPWWDVRWRFWFALWLSICAFSYLNCWVPVFELEYQPTPQEEIYKIESRGGSPVEKYVAHYRLVKRKNLPVREWIRGLWDGGLLDWIL